jgi:hypothetical protein
MTDDRRRRAEDCPICHGEGWVCEDHRLKAWNGGEGCCGGAGALCMCNKWADYHGKIVELERKLAALPEVPGESEARKEANVNASGLEDGNMKVGVVTGFLDCYRWMAKRLAQIEQKESP